MIPDSRQTIHMGINLVMSSFGGVDRRTKVKFQAALLDRGIDFSAVQESDQRALTVVRESPSRLEISVSALAPGVGQLLIVAPNEASHIDMYAEEVESAIGAFTDVWPSINRQLLHCDCTLRDLFESSAEHAFQEIWEHHLGQSSESLRIWGRPVLGGGIRLVMPTLPEEVPQRQIEVKVESFLRDTRKLFVETQVVWPIPTEPDMPIQAKDKLAEVDRYVDQVVVAFLSGETRP